MIATTSPRASTHRLEQLADAATAAQTEPDQLQPLARLALVYGLIHADDIDLVAVVLTDNVRRLSSGPMNRLHHAIRREIGRRA